tara:strand:+ start:717 stop:938 length:222 start_codon:yes stop_codon:yes gene_type:complete
MGNILSTNNVAISQDYNKLVEMYEILNNKNNQLVKKNAELSKEIVNLKDEKNKLKEALIQKIDIIENTCKVIN